MLIIIKKTGSESHFLTALQPHSETWQSQVERILEFLYCVKFIIYLILI